MKDNAAMMRFSISGDWTEIFPGMRVRLQDAPNEEDMEHYEPHGIVILQVERAEPLKGMCNKEDEEKEWWEQRSL